MINKLEKTLVLAVVGIASLCRPALGQWVSCSGGSTTCTSSAVGIGTTGPVSPLDVAGPDVTPAGWGTAGFAGGDIYHRVVVGYSKTNNYGWIQSANEGVSYTNLVLNALGGAVGIGTTSPQVQLHLQGSDSGTSDYGNHTSAALRLTNIDAAAGVGGEIQFSQYSNIPYAAITSIYTNGSGNTLGDLAIFTRNNAQDTNLTPRIYVQSAGAVGIGTTSPSHLLHVAGTIGAEEVIVSSTGADYVFDPGYHLESLADVARYVKENHHLPEIPSAKEMQEKGLNVGEMQTKLLAKIEELTLNLISEHNDNAQLRNEVSEQARQNLKLQERLAKLEANRGEASKP